ncbi:MAG: helix-turn-helix transcriptional regulator [Burkholderiales bacterium]|jgi:DNA-binding CsgD family transcriptional regulator|nr:helix-turn-helix transcriptional regulator [Burkholderiales bacterium]
MDTPVNFDSPGLDAILSDWLIALREFSVHAVVVLGPDPFGDMDAREVVAVHPPVFDDAAHALAQSRDFGSAWRDADGPLVAWQHFARSDALSGERWRMLWRAHGFQTLVRVEFTLPAGRAFECFLFSPLQLHDRAEAALLAWSAFNIWPVIKRAAAQARCKLSPRELECLALAFEGLTAHESALRLGCADRTITYHLANAMAKLKVDSKMAAIQRACWIGAI